MRRRATQSTSKLGQIIHRSFISRLVAFLWDFTALSTHLRTVRRVLESFWTKVPTLPLRRSLQRRLRSRSL
ncbi:hypothetical protein AAC387_Pa01g2481 [Persea americana]